MLKALLPVLVLVCAAPLSAQPAPQDPPAHQHDMSSMASGSWMVMYDGALFATFNDQGSPRGQQEFKAQNWFMVMADHPLGPGQLTLKGMFSAEPLTVTKRGYSELFQMGEAYHNLENIDYQHPHDLFMQLTAAWRVPIGSHAGVTVAGGPVGEATLGPPAFMHRVSASENATAPLTHHTLDSTHIVEGVVAAGVDIGPWQIEGSAFRGREPDENRWDLETGSLDSWAARVWFRPSKSLAAQVSYGFLKEPEQLEPGDERRTTASISWMRGDDDRYLATTFAVGHNERIFDTHTTGYLGEATIHQDLNSVYGRFEVLQVTSEHLLFPTVVHRPHPGELIDWLAAYTVGAVRDVSRRGPFEVGVGGDVTAYTVPTRLVTSPQVQLYGPHPVSFHVFLRVRPRAPAMGHMWNMTMLTPGM